LGKTSPKVKSPLTPVSSMGQALALSLRRLCRIRVSSNRSFGWLPPLDSMKAFEDLPRDM